MEGEIPNAPPPPPPAAHVVFADPTETRKKVEAKAKDLEEPSVTLYALEYHKPLLVGKPSWKRCKEPPTLVAKKDFRIVTWNVWFGQHLQEQRWTALVDEALHNDPDVVCLQECTIDTARFLKENVRVQQNYKLVPEGGFWATDRQWYGVALLVRRTLQPISFSGTPFPSQMGRALLSAVFQVGESSFLAVSTAHFESLNSQSVRQVQLELSKQWALRQQPPIHHHIVLGDFNFFNSSEDASIPEGYHDQWTAVHPELPDEPTWDYKANPTIPISDPSGQWTSRCDRIIMKSDSAKCTQINIIGKEKTVDSNKICPSDHYGLEAVFSIH